MCNASTKYSWVCSVYGVVPYFWWFLEQVLTDTVLNWCNRRRTGRMCSIISLSSSGRRATNRLRNWPVHWCDVCYSQLVRRRCVVFSHVAITGWRHWCWAVRSPDDLVDVFPRVLALPSLLIVRGRRWIGTQFVLPFHNSVYVCMYVCNKTIYIAAYATSRFEAALQS